LRTQAPGEEPRGWAPAGGGDLGAERAVRVGLVEPAELLRVEQLPHGAIFDDLDERADGDRGTDAAHRQRRQNLLYLPQI